MRFDTAIIAALGMLSTSTVQASAVIPRIASINGNATSNLDGGTGTTNVTRTSLKAWELKLHQSGEHPCHKTGNNNDLTQYTDWGYYDKNCVNLDNTKVGTNLSEIESLEWVAHGHKLCPFIVKGCKGGNRHLLPPVFQDESCYPFAGWLSYSVVRIGERCSTGY